MATPVRQADWSGGENRESPDHKVAGNRINSGTVEENGVSVALRSLTLESGVGKVSRIERWNASTSKDTGDEARRESDRVDTESDESDSELSDTSSSSSATFGKGEQKDTTSDDESDESTKRSTVKSLAGEKAGTSSDEEGSESDKDLSDEFKRTTLTDWNADLKKQLEDVNKLLKEAVAEKEQAEAERVAQLEMLKKLLADSTVSQHDGDTMDWQKQLKDLKSEAQMVSLLKKQLKEANAAKNQLQDAEAKHINGNTRYHLVGTTGHIAPKDVKSWERFWEEVMREHKLAALIPDCKCPCEHCPDHTVLLYNRDTKTKPKVVGAHCIVKSNDGAWYIGIVPTCDNCNHVRNTRPITKDCTAVTIFRLSTDPLVGDLGLARPLVKATVAMESLQEQTSRLKCKAGEEEIELCKLLETKTITLSPVKPFPITCIAPIRQEEDESQASSSAAPRTSRKAKLILKQGYKASTSRNNGA